MKMQGDQSFDIKTTKPIYSTFSIREEKGVSESKSYSMSGTSNEYRWAKKSVPALHEEPFTTSIDNYNTRVSFQLNYFQWNAENERHDHMINWTQASKTLLKDEDFGLALDRENNWMSGELNGIVSGASSDYDKSYQIFAYIRANFKATSDQGLFVHSSLKEVFKKREGNVAEINLLLTAMLRKAGIRADPVILSTRDNGIANTGYPLISEYNYVICLVYADNKYIYLDASQSYNGFGQLPASCYNGWAHVINETTPIPVELSADSIREASVTTVIIFTDDKGKSSGAFKTILDKDESYSLREEISRSSLKTYEKKIQSEQGADVSIENLSIDSLKKYEFPLTVNYDFELKNINADILYFNPMMGEGYKTNPFKSMDRHYPVEMSHQIEETYLLNMDIPNGYQVDEMPKSVRVNYNETEGQFEYLIQKGETNIQMRVHLKLKKAFFPVDEYSTLRDFFTFVVKKEGEQIVFKKIK
jgi:hypothetical protein